MSEGLGMPPCGTGTRGAPGSVFEASPWGSSVERSAGAAPVAEARSGSSRPEREPGPQSDSEPGRPAGSEPQSQA
jgi:hypothetical protein